MSFDLIYPKELHEIVNSLHAIVVDVRDKTDYKQGHYPGSVNYEFQGLNEGRYIFSQGRYIIFMCDHGGASTMLARKYAKMGYRCGTVVGGYEAVKKVLKSTFI